MGPRSILGRSHGARFRRSIGVSLALALTLTGCGGGTPSKAEFTKKLREGIGTDLDATLSAQGVDKAVISTAIDELVDCQYESIKDQPLLLETVYDDPTAATVSAQLDTLTEPCSAAFRAVLAENVTIVPTTVPVTIATPTTAPVSVPAPTTDPTSASSTFPSTTTG